MKYSIPAPKVWSSQGKEIFPRSGAIIPAGSIVLESGEFTTLPESVWVLEKDPGNPYDQNPLRSMRFIVQAKK